MKRSAGVTASAVLVFLGSALTLICAAFMVLGLFAISTREAQPRLVADFMIVFVAVMFGAAGWGIATGVGLVNLRSWARMSMLIFSGILLFFTLPGLLIIPFFPMPPQSNLPEHAFTIVRVGMAIFYAALAALAGGWLYFFSRKQVREQFQSGSVPAWSDSSQAGAAGRPLSITIIGWYLLLTTPIFVVMAAVRLPLFFLGYMVEGAGAVAVLLALAAIQVFGGIGLLRLRPWGRELGIYYFIFSMLQPVITAFLPGSDDRFQQAMAAVQARFGALPSPVHISPWFIVVSSLPLYGVFLWFVITRKKAFMDLANGPAPVS